MTVKQVLVAAFLGTAIIGLAVVRMPKAASRRSKITVASSKINTHKDHSHKVAHLLKGRKSRKHLQNSEPQLSSTHLYGWKERKVN